MSRRVYDVTEKSVTMSMIRDKSMRWALAAFVAMVCAGAAEAQSSRLRIGSPPSKLNQKGPLPKMRNPAAPLTGDTSLNLPNNPLYPHGRYRGHGVGLGYPHNYPYYWVDGYQRFRRPQYYDPHLWISYDDWWEWSRTTYRGPLLVEQVRKYDPEVLPEPPPPRVVDEALEALRREEYKAAADQYARRLAELERSEAETPPPSGLSDREQQRLLAVALVGDNRMEDALRHALEAYSKDHSLRGRPILGSSVVPSAAERADLVRSAVTYAQRRDSPHEAWFLVAMLMEADDRPRDARRMMARAEVSFDASLAPPPLPAVPSSPPATGAPATPEDAPPAEKADNGAAAASDG